MEETKSTVPNNKKETKTPAIQKQYLKRNIAFASPLSAPFGKINIDSAMQQETMLTRKLT